MSCNDDDEIALGGCWSVPGCGPPGKFDRTMYRGDSFVFDVQIFKSDGCTPQNITGWTAWFTAKEHYAASDPQAMIRLGSALPLTGVTITSPFEGKLEIIVPPLATAAFPDTPSRLVYDVQVKDGAGRIFTVEAGTLTVRPDVTRATS